MATFVSVETISINTGERMMLIVISNVERLMKLLRALIIHLNLVVEGGEILCMQVSKNVACFRTAFFMCGIERTLLNAGLGRVRVVPSELSTSATFQIY